MASSRSKLVARIVHSTGMRQNKIHSDSSLMDGFRAGQQRCFAEVFELLYTPLCHYALKITKDQNAAEDITEDSFIKIWEKRIIFYEINQLKSYFYRTVRNASLDFVKKQKVLFFEPESLVDNMIVEMEENLQFTTEAETFTLLSKSLNSLPPKGKKVIEMIFYKNKKIREVAEELGISQSTVKTHKERALIYLHSKMTKT